MDFLTIDKIKKTVADFFKVDVAMFDDPTRKQPVTTYRMVAMWFCTAYTKDSDAYISSQFGDRDKKAVSNAVERIDDMINMDKIFRELIFEVKAEIEKALDIQ